MTEEAEVSPDFEDAFAALYPPDVAQLRRTRALAMRDLRAELRALAGTQQQIADKLGIKQPRLNKILRGDAAAISLDNLVQRHRSRALWPKPIITATWKGCPPRASMLGSWVKKWPRAPYLRTKRSGRLLSTTSSRSPPQPLRLRMRKSICTATR